MTHSERILLTQNSLPPSLTSLTTSCQREPGGLDSQDLCATQPTWEVVAGQGSVAKLQEVSELALAVWFPVGETPGSSTGRAVQAKWTLCPALPPALCTQGWQVLLQR